MSESKPVDWWRRARRGLRALQLKYGREIEPALSMEMTAGWAHAAEKDETGQQAWRFVADLQERLAPWKR